MTNKERYAGKKQMTAYVSEEILAKLKQMADDRGMFFGKFIERILVEYVKECKNDN